MRANFSTISTAKAALASARCVALGAIALMGITGTAQAQFDDMEWRYSEFNDPQNRGALTARLVYGVPETDDVRLTAHCSARSSGGLIYVEVGTDVRGLSESQGVTFVARGQGGALRIPAQVTGTQREEGITGVGFTIDPNHRLWNAMEREGRVRVGVEGYRLNLLPTRGANEPTLELLSQCRLFGGGVNTTGGSGVTHGSDDDGSNKVDQRAQACGQKRTRTERIICNDRELTRLDSRLNEVYQDLRRALSRREFRTVRDVQLGWIKGRNACGRAVQCIRFAYEDRIQELERRLADAQGGGSSFGGNAAGVPAQVTPTCPPGYELVGNTCLYNEELAGDDNDGCGPGYGRDPHTNECVSQVVIDESFKLPINGRSLGGIVRSRPDINSSRVTSLREGTRVVILANTGVEMNGYFWYRIRYQGRREAFQWGGIMCSNRQLGGIYETCR